MKWLIVSATKIEIKPLVKSLQFNKVEDKYRSSYYYGKEQIDILITGAGPVFTVYCLTKVLSCNQYDMVINAGICGAFSRHLSIGKVVNVTGEEFADIGTEDQKGFSTIFEKKLADPDLFPFTGGRMINISVQASLQITDLPAVSGITAGTAHGNTETIEYLRKKFNPDIESMEGAAFFYTCLQEKVNFAEIRSVSNYVESRNEENWNIPLAVNNLNTRLISIFEHSSNRMI